MKVLVTGASGLLGRGVVRELKQRNGLDGQSKLLRSGGQLIDRTGPGLVQCDLTDKAALASLIESVKPDSVVHCAAERRPDACEKDSERVGRLNVSLPAQLGQLAVEHGFSLFYISTDYVFDGHSAPSARGYEPDNEAKPTNAYGQSKLDGERAIIENGYARGAKGCVLRVPVLYGQVERNAESAVNVLLDSVRAIDRGESVKMDDWATRYPTNVDDVGYVLAQLVQYNGDLPNVLHFSSQKSFTKLTICEMLAQLHTPPLKLDSMIPVREGPKSGETIRPKDCHLSNAALEKLGIDIRETDFEDWFKQEVARSGS